MPLIVSCPLCTHTKTSVIQRTGVYLDGVEFDLVRCCNCTAVYLNPQPTEVEIEKIYSEDYFLQWYSSEQKREFSKQFFRKLLKQNGIQINNGDHLLDIGCGMGFFLEVARELSSTAKGVEISRYACSHCRQKLGLDVYCGDLKAAPFPAESFDVITAFDVLEHLTGPKSFLERVRRILKVKGQFIVLVPNYGSLVFKLNLRICALKNQPFPNVPEHLTYFTRQSLRRLLESRGFIIRKIVSTGANAEKGLFSFGWSPMGISRAIAEHLCNLTGRIINRQEMILAVAEKPEQSSL